MATQAWTQLWQSLLVSFIDGRVTKPKPDDPVCECTKESAAFTDAWKAKVIADTGTHYLQPAAELSSAPAARRFHSKTARSKLSIPGVAN